MANDIKNLLDAIIGEKDHKADENHAVITKTIVKPVTFDSCNFREKLSLCVLKDVISAMMHDDTKDINDMIDDSIIKHINDDYKGTCFGYLCKARDRLQSPVLGNIVQEIEDKTTELKEGVENGDETAINSIKEPETTTADILKTVNSYDELREKLKDKVFKQVVDNVAGVIKKGNDAPVFDNIDTKLKKVDNNNDDESSNAEEEAPVETTPPGFDETATNESSIMVMTGKIVTEYAINKTPISVDEGLSRAIITYCIGEMDALFDYDRSRRIVAKYL